MDLYAWFVRSQVSASSSVLNVNKFRNYTVALMLVVRPRSRAKQSNVRINHGLILNLKHFSQVLRSIFRTLVTCDLKVEHVIILATIAMKWPSCYLICANSSDY